MKLVKSSGASSDFGLIGRGIEVTGEISFTDQLNVEGKVKGKLLSESGTLTIGDSGHVEAQINVAVCVIYGTIHGDLNAKSRVEIRKTGRVHGDVITPVLLVEEGAVFNGAIRMGQDSASRVIEDVDPEEKMKFKGAVQVP